MVWGYCSFERSWQRCVKHRAASLAHEHVPYYQLTPHNTCAALITLSDLIVIDHRPKGQSNLNLPQLTQRRNERCSNCRLCLLPLALQHCVTLRQSGCFQETRTPTFCSVLTHIRVTVNISCHQCLSCSSVQDLYAIYEISLNSFMNFRLNCSLENIQIPQLCNYFGNVSRKSITFIEEKQFNSLLQLVYVVGLVN